MSLWAGLLVRLADCDDSERLSSSRNSKMDHIRINSLPKNIHLNFTSTSTQGHTSPRHHHRREKPNGPAMATHEVRVVSVYDDQSKRQTKVTGKQT